jgi:hypothetical protein
VFTGIVESIGKVENLVRIQDEWRLTLAVGDLDLSDVKLGDSIAVSGCCLTVVELSNTGFSADVSNETLRCTTLGEFKPGTRVNLEKAMLGIGSFWWSHSKWSRRRGWGVNLCRERRQEHQTGVRCSREPDEVHCRQRINLYRRYQP